MAKIKKLLAREILDSRGFPTVEVDVILNNGICGRAMVPSGASTGSNEAVELRDGDKKRYLGKGVKKAVKNVAKIADVVCGMSVKNQKAIDDAMLKLEAKIGKSDAIKGNLGANAILGVSLAALRASALDAGVSLYERVNQVADAQLKKFKVKANLLPTPMMNIINGGKHADSGLDIQEFMIMPVGAKSFSEALRMASETFHHLKKILTAKGDVTAVGDEGGFAPRKFKKNEDAFGMILDAIAAAGYKGKIKIAIDAAASEFYNADKGKYKFDKRWITGKTLVKKYGDLVKKYPIISIEDGLDEGDWSAWQLLNKKLGKKVQIVGDDLFVTNKDFVKKGIKKDAANAVLIKLNQIGTVSETIETMALADSAGWKSVVSHRSGETEDTTIADFVVGVGAGQIKTGSLARSERIAKYNQLLRIEEQLGKKAKYQAKIR